jgi:15-cis-phytoene synthase
MKSLYDKVSFRLSEIVTKSYSTSFSMGIKSLSEELRDPIYAIYGFVRLADEIVDSFHEYDKRLLFERFKKDVDLSLKEKISLNPVLNSFQSVVNEYKIDYELIEAFMASMEMDLDKKEYDREKFDKYVLGSAEVVGLMCLKVFVMGQEEKYQELKPLGMRLGAAYQKINFLRDLKADFDEMGRSYFPDINLNHFSEEDKKIIEQEIEEDFKEGYKGLLMLPKSSRMGVYLSYIYYYNLFKKIRKLSSKKVISKRIRISDSFKYMLLISSYIKYKLNII